MKYPLRHISVRVPWHDQAWNGHVCKEPSRNTACLCLRNIADNKNDAFEDTIAGKSIEELPENQHPPCVKERGTFMSPFGFTRHHEHPYSKTSNDTHAHFKSTPLHFSAYSAAGLPFRWMQRDFVWGKQSKDEDIRGLVEDYPLKNVVEEREPKLSFNTSWVQEAENHKELLNCFWNHVKPEESLVFFYAKQTPLTEEPVRRVIVGVGRVNHLGPLTEYEYEGNPPSDALRSLLWERMVGHSIRPDHKDGFLMPYHAALEKAKIDPDFDPSEVVAYAPADRFVEFSYATEHVSPDGALAALLEVHDALGRAAGHLEGNFSKEQKWVEAEISRLWKQRGPCPGLGAVLGAMGVPFGSFVANHVVEEVGTESDPWPQVEKCLLSPDENLPADLGIRIDAIIGKSWNRLSDIRKAYIRLLSRFDLSLEQAQALYSIESREEVGIEIADGAFVENPYLLFEATRHQLNNIQVSVETIDRGVFPKDPIRSQVPVPAPSALRSGIDERRIRALTVNRLEHYAKQGHTLQPRKTIISDIRNLPLDPRCEVTSDTIEVAEDECFGDEIACFRLPDESWAYQLRRLTTCGTLIKKTIQKRINGAKHEITADWSALLNAALNKSEDEETISERDKRARLEKVAALPVLANSRVSVLIGPAGTGKTTLLSALVREETIASGGVLLLAPTGKARVRMQEQIGNRSFSAQTIAQFLSGSGRYDGSGLGYRLTGDPGDKIAETVIIDECSMLTEEMLAATLEALAGMKRLILVGDHRQLPPIGAGKPFYDIVHHLKPENIDGLVPKVCAESCYAELTVSMRFAEAEGGRDDIRLASWFTEGKSAQGDDDVLGLLAGNRTSAHLEIIRWNSVEQLHQSIIDVLAKEFPGEGTVDETSFGLSLGGKEHNGYVYFNKGEAGKQAENWQLLTPVRQNGWGVSEINRMLHSKLKESTLNSARKHRSRVIPKPAGSEQIVYGDKVINNRNQRRRVWPKDGLGMLANGEIGMVVGQWKKFNPSILHVEFSTQGGYTYSFFPSEFSDEGSPDLELAYALTIHKAQGSEFGTVFLVLPRNRRMVTREMLYTALTRQKTKVVLLCEGEPVELLGLRNDRFSETKTRLTNLFKAPEIVEFDGAYLDANLIHQTARGELVRSKSEVIIADHLHRHGLDYRYEQKLQLGSDIRIPDFTIEDDDTGITYYWEHCGMMNDPEYVRRWEAKKSLYREHGILPQGEGGGPKGTLIETFDDTNGGISSKSIQELIDLIF